MAGNSRTKTSPQKASKGNAVSKPVQITQEELDLQEIKLPKGIADDPRKASFFYFFFDRTSPTYGNYRGSAIKAGFSETYADRIAVFKPSWISGFIRNQNFVQLAETHLTEVLMLPNISQAMGAFGPVTVTQEFLEDTGEVYKTGKRAGQPKMKKVKMKIPVMKPDTAVIKAKNDAAKIILPAHDPERYGRQKDDKKSFIYNVKEMRSRYLPSNAIS